MDEKVLKEKLMATIGTLGINKSLSLIGGGRFLEKDKITTSSSITEANKYVMDAIEANPTIRDTIAFDASRIKNTYIVNKWIEETEISDFTGWYRIKALSYMPPQTSLVICSCGVGIETNTELEWIDTYAWGMRHTVRHSSVSKDFQLRASNVLYVSANYEIGIEIFNSGNVIIFNRGEDDRQQVARYLVIPL